MLLPRIIPCLLIHNKGLVKTVNFNDPKYVGDPINAVRIYNEMEVDELMVLDIDATVQNKEPDYDRIAKLAVECRMPLCVGGGIKSEDQAQRIFGLGVEKIAMSASAIQDPTLITRISKRVGSQSVVVVMDVKKKLLGGYELCILNGRKKTGLNPVSFARQVQGLGAGEIVVNSIDMDGRMSGYDFDLVESIRSAVSIPLTVLGGAGSLDDIGRLIQENGIIGAAAGSLFVFKGKYRAVLINYPNSQRKLELFNKYLQQIK
jgi:cyclase